MYGHCNRCGCLICLCDWDETGNPPDWRSRALAAEAERDALKAEVEKLRDVKTMYEHLVAMAERQPQGKKK